MKSVWSFFRCGAAFYIIMKVIERILGSSRTKRPKTNVKADVTNAVFRENQLLIWRKPGVTPDQYSQWVRNNVGRYPNLRNTAMCEACEDGLELWEGSDVPTFVVEKVAGAPNPTSGTVVGGSDETAYFCVNFDIFLPEPEWSICKSDLYNPVTTGLPGQTELNDPPLTVAVFDTGLLPAIKDQYTGTVPSCIPAGTKGWNFTVKTPDTNDDHTLHHGSRVSRLIIDQQQRYRNQKLNILPVKVHGSNGQGTLFHVLCAFAYAAKCGAKIINASFGFYAAGNAAPPALMTAFVQHLLTRNNILLVAAAGNSNTVEDSRFLQQSANNPGNNPRDLGVHPFYPACLARYLENVLVVTTVSTAMNTVSPSQNFSSTLVDIGVDCDRILEGDYKFQDPLNASNYIVGSSYATPVITGKIAQHYTELMAAMPGGTISREILLREMKRLGLITADRLSPLRKYVRSGNCAAK